MKRTRKARNFRDHILSSSAASSVSKRKKWSLLLEELAKPELDVPALSQHTTLTFSQMQMQRVMIIPQLIRQLQKQSEPLVLEITKNKVDESRSGLKDVGGVQFENSSELEPEAAASSEGMMMMSADFSGDRVLLNETEMYTMPDDEGVEVEGSVEMEGSGMMEEQMALVEGANEEKQFEIIFSDAARPTDADSDNHIIHSTTERTGTAAEGEDTETVNVPNSFPLFQIVHTGEVPEDLQHEIVRLIRQANPELDLNSITFKFKSPETVEIIANINS